MNEKSSSRPAATESTVEVTVEVGSFVLEAIGGVEAAPSKLPDAIEAYWADREKNRPGWIYPALYQERARDQTVSVQLVLDGELMEGMSAEARRRGASLSELVGHAALYHAAREDSRGR